MGILKTPIIVIKDIEINFDKVADAIYQCYKEDGYIDDHKEDGTLPKDAAEDMYDNVDIQAFIEDNLPAEINSDDIIWDSDYLEDEIYSKIIGLLVKRVENDLI